MNEIMPLRQEEQVTEKATWVFDVETAYDHDRVTSVYKCSTCLALIEAEDVDDHAAWHAEGAS